MMIFNSLSYQRLRGWILLVLLLILIRVVAPYMVRWYVNHSIQQTSGLTGSVRDVDLFVIRGAYRLNGVKLEQQNQQGSYPFLEAQSVSMSILWRSIIQGRLVTKMEFNQPRIVLLDEPKESAIKSDAILNQTTWLGLADDLVVFSIDTLKVNDGEFRFHTIGEKKQAEFFITELNGNVTNITNVKSESSIAEATLLGRVLDKAVLSLTASFDPNQQLPTFDMNVEMSRLSAQYLDQLVDFYAPFDIEAGQVDLVAELVAEQGDVRGYIKAGIYDLDIFSWHEDIVQDRDNPLTALIDMTSGLLSELLENQKENLVATRVPVSGSLKDPDIPISEAIFGLLRNAFIQAYKMDIENLVTFSEQTENKAKTETED